MTSVTPFPVKTQGFYANFNFTVLRPPRVAALFFCCYQETLKNFHPGKRIFQVTFYAAAAGAYYVYFRMYRYMLHVRILWAVRIYKKRLKKRMAFAKKMCCEKENRRCKKTSDEKTTKEERCSHWLRRSTFRILCKHCCRRRKSPCQYSERLRLVYSQGRSYTVSVQQWMQSGAQPPVFSTILPCKRTPVALAR